MAEYTLGTRELTTLVKSDENVPEPMQLTGELTEERWMVIPASVPSGGALAFEKVEATVTAYLFTIEQEVVPNWFGVAVPAGTEDFGNANVFFHPVPGQAGFEDKDYGNKANHWDSIIGYAPRCGWQIAAEGRQQVLIMPLLTTAATGTLGMWNRDWRGIVENILGQVRAEATGDSGAVTLNNLVVSSFSAGIAYSDSFRKHGVGVRPLLREVWDFDGILSNDVGHLSAALHGTDAMKAFKYDQVPAGGGTVSQDAARFLFHAGAARWANHPLPVPTTSDRHRMIPRRLMRHAAWLSGVG